MYQNIICILYFNFFAIVFLDLQPESRLFSFRNVLLLVSSDFHSSIPFKMKSVIIALQLTICTITQEKLLRLFHHFRYFSNNKKEGPYFNGYFYLFNCTARRVQFSIFRRVISITIEIHLFIKRTTTLLSKLMYSSNV